MINSFWISFLDKIAELTLPARRCTRVKKCCRALDYPDWQGPLDFDRFILKHKDENTSTSRDKGEEFLELDELMSLYIQSALTKTNGKILGPNGAARLLGINPSTLRSRIKKLGIH